MIEKSNVIYTHWLRFVLGGIFVFIAGIYIWNAFHYNAYWGYDGGGHIEYIFTLAEESRLPGPNENYLAWHEPLYYVVNGIIVKGLLALGLGTPAIITFLQLQSALWAILFLAGATMLAWLVSEKSKSTTLFVLIVTAGLFIVSGLARYATNEITFHAALVWWLVLFYHWRMYDTAQWQHRRWIWLTLGLICLLWIKLTAVVLVLAVCLWLCWVGLVQKRGQAVITGLVIALMVGLSYVPWLAYKDSVYGQSLTINSYEENVTTRMPLSFFTRFDTSILFHPFWTSGKESFWSMLVASAVVDYDVLFQERRDFNTEETFLVGSGQYVHMNYARESLVLLWGSIAIVLFVVFGIFQYMWKEIKKHGTSSAFFLFIVALGLLLALMFNVYRYPFLERGTMKALFVVSMFPLWFLLAVRGWQGVQAPKSIVAVCWVYVVMWSMSSLLVGVL